MQKNSVYIILLIALIFVVAGYFFVFKKTSQNSEFETIATLKNRWQTVQTLIPFRPFYGEEKGSGKDVWQEPYIVQFIGKDNILTEVEDDNSTHVIIFHFDGSRFSLLEIFKNRYNFTSSDYQNLLGKYGDPSHNASTYTIGLVRNQKTIMFNDLTKVPENIFVKGYAIKNNS